MIEYEIYKIIHLTFIVLMFSCFAVLCFSNGDSKIHKILSGVSTLLILVSGMGLIARIGISHGEPWPLWIRLKLGLWIVIGALTPMIRKRFPSFKQKWFWITIILFSLASYLANYKPM